MVNINVSLNNLFYYINATDRELSVDSKLLARIHTDRDIAVHSVHTYISMTHDLFSVNQCIVFTRLIKGLKCLTRVNKLSFLMKQILINNQICYLQYKG